MDADSRGAGLTHKLGLARLTVGQMFDTPGIVVTESHIVTYAGLSGDFFDVHMDDVAARERGFDRRVAHGLLGLALVDGLKNRAETQFDAIASLEWRYRFVAPIHIGDRIHARIEVRQARSTKDGQRGVVQLGITVLNQHERVVQEGVNTLLVRA